MGPYRPLAQLLCAQVIGAESLGSIPGIVKSAQCRQRLATAATFLCYPSAKRWAPVTFAGFGSQHSPSPLTIAEKMKPFFFKTNRLFFMQSLPKLLSCFHPKQHHPPTKHFSVNHSQGRRENFRAPGQKIRLGPLVSGAPKTHD